PSELMERENTLSKLRKIVKLMGYLPLQTPSLELAETLLGAQYNDDSLKELYGFNGPENIDMALRYEFTLSLARYVASNPTLALPFRCYQYGNVWRVDKPGPGRYREFMQFDIDIVGTNNLLADAEIIAVMVTTFENLGIKNFEVRFSSRKILNGLIEWAGIPDEKGPDVMRVLDKFEKQGRGAVLQELGEGRIDKSGDKIKGLNLPQSQIGKIEEFARSALERDVGSNNLPNPLEWVENNLLDFEEARKGIEELKLIQEYLKNMNIPSSKADIDLTIVRGLGYYTGTVYETILNDLPEYGSVFSGGRYDNLVNRFSGQSIPGVGASIGIDRLLAALFELKAVKKKQAVSEVLVTVMDKDRLPDYLKILKNLRDEQIASEIYCGDSNNLTRQIKYADKSGIPFAVIAGSDEFDNNKVTVKNLSVGREKAQQTSDRKEWLKAEEMQETIPAKDLIAYLKNHLDK
ncbi:MAG: histidine--tRNA ligase, partial [Candidatus Zixiibacteriota bacterium]